MDNSSMLYGGRELLTVATPQIASASHIVVTFNFRFDAHNG
jgi:hypothetical protein